jgi:hypothetical protein
MDLQAKLNLPHDKRKKVLFRDASGTVVGMMALAEEIGAPDGPLDELQREIDGDVNMRARVGGGRLVATWGTAEEIRVFETLLRSN